ncbi:MAG TPA: stage 0 sporulation family protein, partial [Herpetosiphonaceae bacterium]|nr:stage 0 sporulation family protein [Herpetosiphonaceae bacterium]
MTTVVGVRFKDSGKTYHFAPGDVPLAVGDWAIVETVRGPELGRIAAPPSEVPEDQVLGELKPVLRRATQSDMDNLAHYQQYLDDALAICAEKVAELKLPMVLIKAEYNFDGSRLTFFFTSDKRVDFRGLVRDLARTFHTRIELRQVGPRDEAKLLGGIGPCGRLLCCSTFLPDFARVSIKMAKDQDLPLNPTKISGVCGRLLCCLSYEHEQYLDIKAELPPRGAWVQTVEGPGEVIAVNVVRETVTVELATGTTLDCTAAQIAEVTVGVAAEARARNAEGITPVARSFASVDASAGVDADLMAIEDRPPV